MSKTYSGFTAATATRLLLDAGAFFKNFTVGTDTFDTAVAGGKLLGATSGGGEFSAVPSMRRIEVDGVKGAAKGLQVIDEWVIKLTSNMKEISADVIKTALASGASEDGTTGYTKVTAGNYIELTDYIDNVTWVGKLSGSDTPVIIQVFNALSTGGLTLQMQDKNEGVIPIVFDGHYASDDLDTPPFAIHYPKEAVTKGSISGAVTDTGVEVSGATVTATGKTALTTTTGTDGHYSIANLPAGTYAVSAYKGLKSAIELGVVVVAGADTANTDLAIV